jgi:hypothetical protein
MATPAYRFIRKRNVHSSVSKKLTGEMTAVLEA